MTQTLIALAPLVFLVAAVIVLIAGLLATELPDERTSLMLICSGVCQTQYRIAGMAWAVDSRQSRSGRRRIGCACLMQQT
jgi:hypothetical protein